jgi:hypothetical protein
MIRFNEQGQIVDFEVMIRPKVVRGLGCTNGTANGSFYLKLDDKCDLLFIVRHEN